MEGVFVMVLFIFIIEFLLYVIIFLAFRQQLVLGLRRS